IGGLEAVDRAEQMLVIFAQLQLDGAAEGRVAGELRGRARRIAASIDERTEAEALQPLRHGAAVPAERPRRRLHVEAVMPEGGENRDVRVARLGRARRRGQ